MWKKILKVMLLVATILFIVYRLLFYTVDVYERDEEILKAEYEEYILVSFVYDYWKYFFPGFPDLRLFGGWGSGGGDSYKTIIFFRWDANVIKENLTIELGKKLEQIGKSSAVVNYTYNEKIYDVDITFDESSEEYNDILEDYDDFLEELAFVRRFCKYDSIY